MKFLTTKKVKTTLLLLWTKINVRNKRPESATLQYLCDFSLLLIFESFISPPDIYNPIRGHISKQDTLVLAGLHFYISSEIDPKNISESKTKKQQS